MSRQTNATALAPIEANPATAHSRIPHGASSGEFIPVPAYLAWDSLRHSLEEKRDSTGAAAPCEHWAGAPDRFQPVLTHPRAQKTQISCPSGDRKSTRLNSSHHSISYAV